MAIFALLVAVASASSAAVAQETPPGADRAQPGPARGPDDPFGRYLFPPELVMQNQGEIGLTETQRSALQKAFQDAQAKVTDQQWKMSAEAEKLTKLLEPAQINEVQALEQIDRILTIEREVKRAQTGLLIRIKNTLTPAQQAKLAQLRERRR
jgi:Spy/CpxP family protein refolding chaperone